VCWFLFRHVSAQFVPYSSVYETSWFKYESALFKKKHFKVSMLFLTTDGRPPVLWCQMGKSQVCTYWTVYGICVRSNHAECVPFELWSWKVKNYNHYLCPEFICHIWSPCSVHRCCTLAKNKVRCRLHVTKSPQIKTTQIAVTIESKQIILPNHK